MYTIKALEGKRWFIWTLVFLVASGVALVSYISLTDLDSVPTQLRHKSASQEQKSSAVNKAQASAPAAQR
jgi:hypothetical protein